MKNVVCGVILTILVLSMLTLVLSVRPVKAWTWTGTIYIRADGSIDPSTAPILRDGDLYTLTENIDSVYGMIIERSNMTLDGADNILQHVGVHDLFVGIWLSGTTNVTITNIEIKDFDYGVHLEKSFNNKITGNQLMSSSPALIGMRLESSSYNIISDNNVTGWVYWSLYLNESSDNVMYRNNFAAGTFEDVFLKGGSSNNTIYNNNFSVPRFSDAESNFFDNGYPSGGNYYRNGPKIADFLHGPSQNETGSDGILDSPIGPDRYPLVFPINSPPRPPVAEFTVLPSSYLPVMEPATFEVSFMLPGWNGSHVMPLTECHWDFGDGNITSTVNASIDHVYDQVRRFDVTLIVVDSQGSSASYTRWIEAFWWASISISTGSASTFVGYAVDVNGTLQDAYGTAMQDQTVVLYYTFLGTDTWVPIASDITDQFGNYHILWIPPATGYFTIIAEWTPESAYPPTTYNNVSLSSIPYQSQYVFSVESNSTVSAMTFNSTGSELSFIISGEPGTRGYVKATIAKSLVADIADLHVYINGTQTEYSVDSLGDTWVLTFTYNHSTHFVKIGWTRQSTFDLVQYIPFIAAVAVVAVVAIVSVAVIRRRRKKKT